MQTPWEYRYAGRTAQMSGSVIRELLKLTEEPDIISFAGGMPAPELFPTDALAEAADRVLRAHGRQALQYGPTEGHMPLRRVLAARMARYGLQVTVDNIAITSGSQQALDLLGKLFINRGDRIVVEAPTYLGALQAWNAYGAQYLSVPTDADGMDVDALEEALRAGPRFIYALPNFQNPGGFTLSLERRKRIVALADRYGVPIVEDDPYGQLRFEGEHLPPLVVLDGAAHQDGAFCYSGNIIYLSTFSKILAPGLRLGWVVAPEQVIRKLVTAKQGADLQTATLNQMIACEVAGGPFLDEHVRRLRQVYSERRDTMVAAMSQFFPPGVRWSYPQGGLFLFVTLPEGIDAAAVLPDALRQKVAFVPGGAFFANGGGANTLRLNFSNATPEKIRDGIERLGGVLRAHVAGRPAAAARQPALAGAGPGR